MKYKVDSIIKEYLISSGNVQLFNNLNNIIINLSFLADTDNTGLLISESIYNNITELESDILGIISLEESMGSDMIIDEIHSRTLMFSTDVLKPMGIQITATGLDISLVILDTLVKLNTNDGSDKSYLETLVANNEITDLEKLLKLIELYNNISTIDYLTAITEVILSYILKVIENMPDVDEDYDVEFINKVISLDNTLLQYRIVKDIYRTGKDENIFSYIDNMYKYCNEYDNLSDVVFEIVLTFLLATDTRGNIDEYIETHIHLDMITLIDSEVKEAMVKEEILSESYRLYNLLNIR